MLDLNYKVSRVQGFGNYNLNIDKFVFREAMSMKPGIIGLNNWCHFVNTRDGCAWLRDVNFIFIYHCDSIKNKATKTNSI